MFKRNIIMPLLLLIFLYCASTCDTGCLKCSNQRCLCCDYKNNFFLINGACLQKQIKNCDHHSLEGKCLTCKKKHFFNQKENSCQLIKHAEEIPNCDYYEGDKCIQCRRDYYLKDNSCLPVKIYVNHCLVNKDERRCSQCELNNILSFDNKICIYKQSQNKCQFWSQIMCSSCRQDFFLNKNNYIKDLFQDNADSKVWQQLMHSGEQQFHQMIYSDTCVPMKIKNCLEMINDKTCFKCQPNFYLSEQNDCIQFPHEPIESCVDYLDYETCIKCDSVHYLEDNQCKIIVQVSHCREHDTYSNQNICLQCNEEFYLENNKCIYRQKSSKLNFPNCIKRALDKDICIKCSDEFVINPLGTICFVSILNCLEHYYSYLDLPPSCVRCNDGFYLANKICEPGMILNCLQYLDRNICIKCENGFHLIKNYCFPNVFISDCLEYENFTSRVNNVCLKCRQNFMTLQIDTLCLNMSPIENCVSYDSNSTSSVCLKCERGFYLTLNKCMEFANQNCQEAQDINTCLQCEPGYGLDVSQPAVFQCRKPHKFQVRNCLQSNLTAPQKFDDIKCEVCGENFTFLNVQNSFVCIEETEFELKNFKYVENCKQYDEDGCTFCWFPFLLQKKEGKTTCVPKCDLNQAISLISLENVENGLVIGDINACIKSQNTCSAFAPKTFGNYLQTKREVSADFFSNHICISCPNSHVEVVDFQNPNFSNMNFSNGFRHKMIHNQFDFTPQVLCKPKSEVALVNFCLYYRIDPESEKVYCQLCKHGYRGVIGKENSKGFIEKCELFEECNPEKKLNNIFNPYNYFISCHRCMEKDKIVFIALSLKTQNESFQIEGVDQYNLNNENFTLVNPEEKSYTTHCLKEKYFEQFQTNIDDFKFPSFCALAVINTTSRAFSTLMNNQNFNQSNLENLSVYCAACFPGFRPQYLNDQNQGIVVQCINIPFCSYEYIELNVNICPMCGENNVYEFKEGNIYYENCIFIENNINCFSAEIVDSKSICRICKKNYQMNKDNFCEQININYCLHSELYAKQDYPLFLNVLDFSLYSFQNSLGCSKCEEGFLSFKMKKDLDICVSTNYMTKINKMNNYFQQDYQHVQNCLNHGIKKGKMFCVKCEQNYILTDTHRKCVKDSSNCLLLNNKDESQCLLCDKNLSLIKFKCVLANIDNCKSYYNDVQKTKILCKQCMDGYFMDSSEETCQKGNISDCKIYEKNDPLTCLKCFDGFHLLKPFLCYKFPEDFPCSQIEIKGGLACKECKHLNQIIASKEKIQEMYQQGTYCLPVKTVENCSEYEENIFEEKNDQICKKCTSKYFLEGLQCKRRVNVVQYCQEYSTYKDSCQVCSQGNFLSLNQTECISFPSGQIGCFNYSNQESCSQCRQNFYKKYQRCIPMSPWEKDLFENCLVSEYIKEKIECLECAPSYLLSENTCVKQVALNCLTSSDLNNCLTCKKGFGLEKVDGNTNCVYVLLNNCLKHNQIHPFVCIQCEAGYYESEGTCFDVKKTIDGCEFYGESHICNQCQEDYILSSDQTECLHKDQFSGLYDPNCTKMYISLDPECVGCAPGHYFKKGKCYECPVIKGCFQCDPDNSFACILCKPGYYQANGDCFRSQQILEDLVNSSAFILTHFLLLIVIN